MTHRDRPAHPDGLPPDVDHALWFDSEPCGRHYLLEGNPHTFRGRMLAYCPQDRRYTRVSKAEFSRCSPEAAYFVRGFLSGSEPEPPRRADGDLLDEGDPRTERWTKAIELFRENGFWLEVERAPCNRCGAELLPSENEPEHGRPCRQCPTGRPAG